jgi:prepilin-type N-terminal cleavage/methylation domain-containing protein
MKNIRLMRRVNQKGFTIIELMIASAVFASILLLLTMGLLAVSRTYYKGVVTTRTQQVSRSILEDISESIRFNGGTVAPSIVPNGTSRGFCAGGKRYSYQLNKQLNEAVASQRHVIVVDDFDTCSAGTVAQSMSSATPTGRELMSTRMRLGGLSITQVGTGTDLWRVTVRVASGEDDILEDTNGDGVLDTCRQERSGSQFCAVSELSTVVQKRVR